LCFLRISSLVIDTRPISQIRAGAPISAVVILVETQRKGICRR
jgi:hypothetical protein